MLQRDIQFTDIIVNVTQVSVNQVKTRDGFYHCIKVYNVLLLNIIAIQQLISIPVYCVMSYLNRHEASERKTSSLPIYQVFKS